MKVFVIGKSAREQAFIEKISTSPKITEIFCAPGNPAIASFANCTNIAIGDLASFVEFAKEKQFDLTVVFDENLISQGIANIFKNEGLKIFAPSQEASKIGTSRAFSKKFLYKQKIPISKYGVFDKENSALDFAKKSQFPIRIKYDYIAEQDSFLCNTLNQAGNILAQLFYDGQKKVVIEEYIDAPQYSLSIITDGYQVLPLPYVKIQNRIDKNGNIVLKEEAAYTPVAQITDKIEAFIAQKIIFPLLDGLQNCQTPYVGFLSLDFSILPDGKILTFDIYPSLSNAQAVCIFQLIEDDLFDIIYTATQGALEDCYPNIYYSKDAVQSKILLAQNGNIIEGIEELDNDNIELYYNDVGMNKNYEISANGQKAFYITGRAATLNQANKLLEFNSNIIRFK